MHHKTLSYFFLFLLFFLMPLHAVLVLKISFTDGSKKIHLLGDVHDQPQFKQEEKNQIFDLVDICSKQEKPLTVLVEAVTDPIKINWNYSLTPHVQCSLIRDVPAYIKTLKYNNINLQEIDNRRISGLAFKFFKYYEMPPLFGSEPKYVRKGSYHNEYQFTFKDLFKEIFAIQKKLCNFAQTQPENIASTFEKILNKSMQECDLLQEMIEQKEMWQKSMLTVANEMWIQGIIDAAQSGELTLKDDKNNFIQKLYNYRDKVLKPYIQNYPNQKEGEGAKNFSLLDDLLIKYVNNDGLKNKKLYEVSDDRKLIFTYLFKIINPLFDLNIIKNMLLSKNDTVIIAGCAHIYSVYSILKDSIQSYNNRKYINYLFLSHNFQVNEKVKNDVSEYTSYFDIENTNLKLYKDIKKASFLTLFSVVGFLSRDELNQIND